MGNRPSAKIWFGWRVKTDEVHEEIAEAWAPSWSQAIGSWEGEESIVGIEVSKTDDWGARQLALGVPDSFVNVEKRIKELMEVEGEPCLWLVSFYG